MLVHCQEYYFIDRTKSTDTLLAITIASLAIYRITHLILSYHENYCRIWRESDTIHIKCSMTNNSLPVLRKTKKAIIMKLTPWP